MWSSKKVRESFIKFFENRGHKFVESAPVIPINDPTLLFTNAGMNQFKDIFLGKINPDFSRATNSQKCIRVSGKHNDLEEVGKDTYHHTFFEMLGNWSFGDYYKKDAIKWAWELVTEVWKLPKDKLYATVYLTDDEALKIWQEETDIDNSHILKFGDKDNFWSMGETGPCGPCSEIHFDLGEEHCSKKGEEGHICAVNGDCGRFIEIWNLVFMQYNQNSDGTRTLLPKTHVDTGAGLERITAILQNKMSNYDTDLFYPIIEKLGEITDVEYSDNPVSYRVIADHIRAMTVAISDGVVPSNEGRGYVIRRILRRAARHGRLLNLKQPFLYKLSSVVVDILGDAFHEIKNKSNYVANVIKSEEEKFNATLDRGLDLFDKEVLKLEKAGKNELSGKIAFLLHDTYGFPFDLTKIMAEEKGFSVNEEEFLEEMKKQKERSRAEKHFVSDYNVDAKKFSIINNVEENSIFRGYNYYELMTKIVKYRIKDDIYEVVLDETPFYAESGGQIGDTGKIYNDEMELQVIDTQKIGNEILHICKLSKGKINSANVYAVIDKNRRKRIMRNHTATHLLQAALQKVLGENVKQAGSFVADDRLRFDFTFFRAISTEELQAVEKMVNSVILDNIGVSVNYVPIDEAKKRGAMALFGEKYGDIVRVVSVGEYSIELCGGSHVNSTGEIGLFKILSESAVSSGIRRIEAITGDNLLQYLTEKEELLHSISQALKTPQELCVKKIEKLLKENNNYRKEIEQIKAQNITSNIDDILNQKMEINDSFLICHKVANKDKKEFAALGDSLSNKLSNGVIFLINVGKENASFLVKVDKLAIKRGFHAGEILKKIASLFGGKGGGSPHRAMGGSSDMQKIRELLPDIKDIVADILRKEN